MADAEKHLARNNFEAWVCVDGKALTQYGEECNEQRNETVCWIASQSDQAFSIFHHKKVTDEYDYIVSIYLDGALVHDEMAVGPDTLETWEGSSVRTSITECMAFVFGCVETTDDNNISEYCPQNIGEIKIVITQVKAALETEQVNFTPLVVPEPLKVDERSNKGVAHRIKYRMVAEEMTETNSIVSKFKEYEMLATFIFMYRPLSTLQANNIAPRASATDHETAEIPHASPQQSEVKFKVEPEDDLEQEDENADILEREKALLAELEQVRRERELLAELEKIRVAKRAAALAKDKRPKKKVRTEQRPQFTPGEIVDLT